MKTEGQRFVWVATQPSNRATLRGVDVFPGELHSGSGEQCCLVSAPVKLLCWGKEWGQVELKQSCPAAQLSHVGHGSPSPLAAGSHSGVTAVCPCPMTVHPSFLCAECPDPRCFSPFSAPDLTDPTVPHQEQCSFCCFHTK